MQCAYSTFKNNNVWKKEQINMGYTNNSHMLIGGNIRNIFVRCTALTINGIYDAVQ